MPEWIKWVKSKSVCLYLMDLHFLNASNIVLSDGHGIDYKKT